MRGDSEGTLGSRAPRRGRILRWGNIPDGGRGVGDAGSIALLHGQRDRYREALVRQIVVVDADVGRVVAGVSDRSRRTSP